MLYIPLTSLKFLHTRPKYPVLTQSHCAMPQDHEKGLTDAHLSRESEKAKNLKNEAESYSTTLKDIINTVSRAQAAMGLDCTLDSSLREIPRPMAA